MYKFSYAQFSKPKCTKAIDNIPNPNCRKAIKINITLVSKTLWSQAIMQHD